jgi:hypothetical protein
VNKLRDTIEKEPEGPVKAAKVAGPVKRLPGAFVSLLNGTFLTRENVLGNMSFILFCAGLMILYIAYGYSTERIVRDLHRTDAELKELRSEYITVRARLEKQEQQSHVASGIGELGLRESRVPPIKITVGRKDLKRTRTP